jgi:uncharacterized protein with von Willebrand factor type A (vWA) domain
MRKIGQKALGDLFARLRRDRFGEHDLTRLGHGGDRGDDSKGYEFGDPFDLDVQRTVMNAVTREAEGARQGPTGPLPGRDGRGVAPRASSRRVPRLHPEDFEIHQTESLTRSATVLMLDMSRSMPLRGYFYAAKNLARVVPSSALPQLTVNEYVYGTNFQHALMLARRILGRSHAENKQVIIVSDGEPTAHMEGGRPVFSYPPLPETLVKTLIEVRRCTLERIVINTFMLESNRQLVRFVDQMTRLNRGRAFFVSPESLGDYVLVDYVRSRPRAAA